MWIHVAAEPNHRLGEPANQFIGPISTRPYTLNLPGLAVHRVLPLDFDHTDTLVADAYEAARTFLEFQHVDGPGLYGSP